MFSKHSVFSLFSFCILLVLLGSCESSTTDTVLQKPEVTMYKDAPLALNMREIHEQFKNLKQGVKNDSVPVNFHVSGYKIDELTPTDSTIKGPVFTGFANHFALMCDSLQQTNLDKQVYNAAVSSCINCHQEFCPGPVSTISKLYVK